MQKLAGATDAFLQQSLGFTDVIAKRPGYMIQKLLINLTEVAIADLPRQLVDMLKPKILNDSGRGSLVARAGCQIKQQVLQQPWVGGIASGNQPLQRIVVALELLAHGRVKLQITLANFLDQSKRCGRGGRHFGGTGLLEH